MRWQQQRRVEGWRQQREEGEEGVGRRQTSGNSDDGEVEHDGGDNNDNEDEDNVNIDVVKDDGNDGMTMMRWQQGRMDYDDAMVVVGQRHAEHSRVPRHPSKATINLCRQFG